MKTYSAYKNQIREFKDVSETVKTVEKIAASSVHFLKREVSNLDAYALEIERALARLSLFHPNGKHPLLRKKKKGKTAVAIITGDKGLVGGLWHAIIGAFLEKNWRGELVIAIGKKGENYLKEENMPVFSVLKTDDAGSAADYIFSEFKKSSFSRVDILYPQFLSLARQKPNFIRFLPFEFTSLGIDGKAPREKARRGAGNGADGLPIFEPSKQKIFENLLRKYIGVFFRKIIMEAKLSELSARTVAMERAADKTDKLVSKLSLDYTKERRRAVTQRQLESFSAHKVIK